MEISLESSKTFITQTKENEQNNLSMNSQNLLLMNESSIHNATQSELNVSKPVLILTLEQKDKPQIFEDFCYTENTQISKKQEFRQRTEEQFQKMLIRLFGKKYLENKSLLSQIRQIQKSDGFLSKLYSDKVAKNSIMNELEICHKLMAQAKKLSYTQDFKFEQSYQKPSIIKTPFRGSLHTGTHKQSKKQESQEGLTPPLEKIIQECEQILDYE